MKSWKSLFVKTEENETKPAESENQFNFPISNNAPAASTPQINQYKTVENEVLNEVIAVYERGIESINMPGYDFFEFYKAISSINNAGDQAYKMAFQMAKSMDSNVTTQKLVTDAEFYISKINEVHDQYELQGQQKVNSIEAQKNEEKNKLRAEIDGATEQLKQLRLKVQKLETEITQNRNILTTVDGKYLPQETSIHQKLSANDAARNISTGKLNNVKENILRYIN
jgi:hypothetical protein